MREHLRRQDAPARPEGKFSPVIVFVDNRCDPMAAEIGHSIQVGDESERRAVLISRSGRDVGVEIALCVHLHVRDPHGEQLPVEMPGELKLAGGRGNRAALFIAGSPYGGIF